MAIVAAHHLHLTDFFFSSSQLLHNLKNRQYKQFTCLCKLLEIRYRLWPSSFRNDVRFGKLEVSCTEHWGRVQTSNRFVAGKGMVWRKFSTLYEIQDISPLWWRVGVNNEHQINRANGKSVAKKAREIINVMEKSRKLFRYFSNTVSCQVAVCTSHCFVNNTQSWRWCELASERARAPADRVISES